jgi:hypothetical protein
MFFRKKLDPRLRGGDFFSPPSRGRLLQRYSTVTDFAKLRGLSTSFPLRRAA